MSPLPSSPWSFKHQPLLAYPTAARYLEPGPISEQVMGSGDSTSGASPAWMSSPYAAWVALPPGEARGLSAFGVGSPPPDPGRASGAGQHCMSVSPLRVQVSGHSPRTAHAWLWSPKGSFRLSCLTCRQGQVPDGGGCWTGAVVVPSRWGLWVLTPHAFAPTDARVLVLSEGDLQQQQLSVQPRLRVPEGGGLHGLPQRLLPTGREGEGHGWVVGSPQPPEVGQPCSSVPFLEFT